MFKSELASNIIHSYSSRIILIILGLVGNVIITRSLGVENYGIYTLLLTVVALATQFGNFGLHSANIYYVAQKKMFLGMLLKNSIWFSIIMGVFVSAIVLFVNFLNPKIFDIDLNLLLVALIIVPISLMALLIKNLLVGIGEIKLDNKLTVYTRVITIVTLICVVTFYQLDIIEAIIVFGLGLLFALIITYNKLRQGITYRYKLSMRLLKKISKFGFKAYLSAILAFLVLKSDLFFVNYYLTKTDLGHYSLAVSFIDYIYLLPVVIGTVLFQKLSSLKKNDEKYILMKKITFVFSGVYFLFLVCVYFISDYLIIFLYGEQFNDSVILINILLIGIYFMGIGSLLLQYIAVRYDFPHIIIKMWFFAFVVNVGLNFILVNEFKLFGIAISSVVAYAIIACTTIEYIIRKNKNDKIKL